MSHITVDDPVLSQLRGTNKVAEVRDPGGNVVGYFAPVSNTETARHLSILARYDPLETKRHLAEGGEKTTAEVFEHLLTLTQGESMRTYLCEKIKTIRERNA